MTREDIVALFARRDEAWARGDVEALTQTHAEDSVAHSPMQGRLEGRARIRAVYHDWFGAFPGLTFRTDSLLVDGNRAAQFFTVSGTHSGTFGGVPATGRRFQITGAWLFTLADDGQIVEDRRVYDVTNMLVQIGALRTKPLGTSEERTRG
jgi:steroid delta-isomerase-like uncharacterized protein